MKRPATGWRSKPGTKLACRIQSLLPAVENSLYLTGCRVDT